MKLLFIGDVVGAPGRAMLQEYLPLLKSRFQPDIVVVNGENAAGGRGITAEIARQFFEWGVHCITMGNHTWDNKAIFDFIDDEPRLVRPANYPPGTPGRGYTVVAAGGRELAVVNLMGRTFLPPLDCPFRTAQALV
ncbi:MAG: YmdB family metallophosphoesterase, partial [Calditerricola sp.]|nr:YmdB family metallophosphoesterase [Calditerricola sp.]